MQTGSLCWNHQYEMHPDTQDARRDEIPLSQNNAEEAATVVSTIFPHWCRRNNISDSNNEKSSMQPCCIKTGAIPWCYQRFKITWLSVCDADSDHSLSMEEAKISSLVPVSALLYVIGSQYIGTKRSNKRDKSRNCGNIWELSCFAKMCPTFLE